MQSNDKPKNQFQFHFRKWKSSIDKTVKTTAARAQILSWLSAWSNYVQLPSLQIPVNPISVYDYNTKLTSYNKSPIEPSTEPFSWKSTYPTQKICNLFHTHVPKSKLEEKNISWGKKGHFHKSLANLSGSKW